MHFHLDLARPDWPWRSDLPAERVEPSGMPAPQREDIGGIGEIQRETAAPSQHVAPVGCPDNLVVGSVARQFVSDLPGAIVHVQSAGQIEQAQREARCLVRDHTRETPQRAAHNPGGLTRL